MIEDGIYGFWKPKGPSSAHFLNGIKRKCYPKKVGHAGTLDPLAEGILAVGIGKGTKMLSEEVAKEKEYLAGIRLGVTSTTDDEEGEKAVSDSLIIPSLSEVKETIADFVGDISQVPPAFSALKIGGTEAYKLARKGVVVEMKARPAKVMSAELISYSYPDITVRFVTGPGVYIRSLARDIGAKLGVGGYMSSLIRERVGSFTKGNAIDPESL